jgi:hypothetical protein
VADAVIEANEDYRKCSRRQAALSKLFRDPHSLVPPENFTRLSFTSDD